jgi:esterase/lipase superfamily enzyme
MNREATELWSAALGAAGTVIRYGHYGRPVLVFASERGRAWDFENNGMIGAVQDLIDAGRVKLYCVDQPGDPARGTRPAARPLRVLDRRRRGAVDLR